MSIVRSVRWVWVTARNVSMDTTCSIWTRGLAVVWVGVPISTFRPMPSCVHRVHIRVICVNWMNWTFQRSNVFNVNWTPPSTSTKVNVFNPANAPIPPTLTLNPLPPTNHAKSAWVIAINAKMTALHVLTVCRIIIFITKHVSINKTVPKELLESLLIPSIVKDCVLCVIQHVDHALKLLISVQHVSVITTSTDILINAYHPVLLLWSRTTNQWSVSPVNPPATDA